MVKRVINFIIFGLVLLIVLKSCIITVISFDELILVEGTFERGEKDRILITPEREMFYTKTLGEIKEFGLYEIKGEEATHYLFGIYCIGNFMSLVQSLFYIFVAGISAYLSSANSFCNFFSFLLDACNNLIYVISTLS